MHKEWIGLLLMLVLVTLFYWLYPPRLKVDETRRIAGRLAAVPDHSTYGGDFKHHYVRLTLAGYPDEFEAKQCSYDRLNFTALNRLESGDSLTVFVIEGGVNVYAIESKGETILDISDVNECNSRVWRKTFYLGMLIGSFLIFRVYLVPAYRRLFGVHKP